MHTAHIQLNPSPQFIAITLGILLATLLIILFLQCSVWLKLILISSALPYGMSILYRYALLQHRDSIIGVTQLAEGWQLHTKTKIWLATLAGESTVTTYVSVLRFNITHQRHKRSLLIFKDSFADKEDYRRFCLQLKLSG